LISASPPARAGVSRKPGTPSSTAALLFSRGLRGSPGMPERHFLAATAIAAVKCSLSFTIRRRRISVMPRFCKATSMVPCCRGAEHPASRRGRIRIIAIPTVEEVVVAVSIEPRRCGRARKHGRGPEYQESKFPCHDRGSSALTIGRNFDQSAACSKRRIRRMRGCALTFAQISLAFRKE
jgi:hypothetical protein